MQAIDKFGMQLRFLKNVIVLKDRVFSFLDGHEYLMISAALAIVIALSYGNVAFMDCTLSPASLSAGVTPTGPYDYSGRNIATLPIIDPAASGTQNLPLHKLVTQYFSRGKWPLWNPHQAAGTPLAADTVISVYAPVNLLHFLPNELWDIPTLLRLWLAGIFTYSFLRNHKVCREGAFVGAVLYMFSGAFTWFINLDHLNVTMLTPLLLLSLDRLVTRKKVSDICLTSLVIMLSLLGAHIETLILQFIFVILYYGFRVLGSSIHILLAQIFRLVLSFAMGFSLSAFFLLPVFEYLANSSLCHESGSGLGAVLPYSAITSFVPYFFGQVQSYLSPTIGRVVSWDGLGGYVGVCSLYLSLVGIISYRTTSVNKHKKRFTCFFLAIAIIALFKTYGVTPIQWIAYIPVLDLIAFTRYLGPIWTFGLSVAAAMGVESILLCKASKKTLMLAFLTSLLAIAWLASLSVPFPLIPGSLSFYYSGSKFVEGSAFICVTTLLSLKVINDRKLAMPMIGLIVLEMAFYIPQGMTYRWELIRSLIVLSNLAAFVAVMINQTGGQPRTQNHGRRGLMRTSTRKILLLLILISLIAQDIVAGLSPQGLPQRNDAFKEAPYISFLERNAGLSRVYTFDYVLPPPYAGVFDLYDIGIFSAFNVASFNLYAARNLDPGRAQSLGSEFPNPTVLASNEWFRKPDAPGPVAELQRNIEFYSFLGLKYIVTNTTDPNFAPEIVGGDLAIPIDNPRVTIEQSFVTITNNLSSIAIQLGTNRRKNHGSITLTLDSIPYKEEYHRTAVIPAESVCDSWPPTIFSFRPIEDSRGEEFCFTLQFPQANSTNVIAVWSYSEMHPYAAIVREVAKGHLSVNGKPSGGNVAFSLSSNSFPLVYDDDVAKIYENPKAFPRTFIVHKFRIASSLEEALEILRNPEFSLREEVVLNVPPSEIEAKNLEQAPTIDDSSAEILRYETDKVIVKVYAQHSGLLVLTDTYYPGWKAYIDGKPTTIYQADGLVRAVYVSEGEHTVEFIYFPESFQIGLAVTIISLAALLIFVIMDRFKVWRRRSVQMVDTARRQV